MKTGTLVKLFIASLIAVILGLLLYQPTYVTPTMDEPWWGLGEMGNDSTAIRPFKIKISNQVLLDLKNRLKEHRPLVPALSGSFHNYGINPQLLTNIIEYWRDSYDWREREKILNKYPQFKTKIQGLDIHFLHVNPNFDHAARNYKVYPLLMLNGWGSSFREFYDVISLLTTTKEEYDFTFAVVVPSMPGFAFSEATTKQGLNVAHIAVIFKNLMLRLGYKHFYVHGGDWGAAVATTMATLYPNHVRGLHSTMCYSKKYVLLKYLIGALYPSLFVEDQFVDKIYPISRYVNFLMLETGYMHMQATKPDTIGVGLNDSPVGFAAYMFEKYITWTNPAYKDSIDGGLQKVYSLDDLLDTIMIYWVTNSITTSMRIYAESITRGADRNYIDQAPVLVPTACPKFEYELFTQPNWFLRSKFYNLIQSHWYADGGHFPAMQLPGPFADDIWSSVRATERDYRKLKETEGEK